eukprot:COSAG06_NODE_7198_length_2587_cov_3.098071_3_plen_67_part_00
MRGAKTRLRRPANGGDSTPLGSLNDLYLEKVIQCEVVIALMNVFAGSMIYDEPSYYDAMRFALLCI